MSMDTRINFKVIYEIEDENIFGFYIKLVRNDKK